MIGDGKAVGGADSSSVQWGDIDIESTHSSSSRSAEIVRDEKVSSRFVVIWDGWGQRRSWALPGRGGHLPCCHRYGRSPRLRVRRGGPRCRLRRHQLRRHQLLLVTLAVTVTVTPACVEPSCYPLPPRDPTTTIRDYHEHSTTTAAPPTIKKVVL